MKGLAQSGPVGRSFLPTRLGGPLLPGQIVGLASLTIGMMLIVRRPAAVVSRLGERAQPLQ
jgi:hypothetical protein